MIFYQWNNSNKNEGQELSNSQISEKSLICELTKYMYSINEVIPKFQENPKYLNCQNVLSMKQLPKTRGARMKQLPNFRKILNIWTDIIFYQWRHHTKQVNKQTVPFRNPVLLCLMAKCPKGCYIFVVVSCINYV